MILDQLWTLLNERIEGISKRVSTLEAKETSLTFDEFQQTTFADASAEEPTGIASRYITDGLREGGGTGVLAYFDGSTWRRISDNQAVTT